MKLSLILKEVLLVPRIKLLKEATNDKFFLLQHYDIYKAMLKDFLTRTPIMQKLLSKNRGVSEKSLSLAIEHLVYTDNGIEKIWKDLERANPPDGVRASKDEIDLAKREMVSFSNEFKKDLPGIVNVANAVITGYNTGNGEDFDNLSAKDARSYLKYYTSDAVNIYTDIRNAESYDEFVTLLNEIINGV